MEPTTCRLLAPCYLQVLCDTAAATAPVPVIRKVPRSLSEIDNGKILGFGADLAKDHPVSAYCIAWAHAFE